MPLTKLDSQGKFTPFPGVTVVAHVNPIDSLFWNEVYKLIAETNLNQHYAALPADSYHMTAINLFTQEEVGIDKWEGFIKKHLVTFQALNQSLISTPFNLKISIKTILTRGVIQLWLSIADEQKQIIKDIAEQHKMAAGVPDVFHITLAYQYQPITEVQSEAIRKKFTSSLQQLVSKFKPNFLFTSPRLCYFNDITAFKPWDGKVFPFTESVVSNHHWFKKAKPKEDKKPSIELPCNIL